MLSSNVSDYRHARRGSLNILPPNSHTRPMMAVPRFDGPRSPPAVSHVPCKFFRQGTCQAGNACSFSHDLSAVSENICKYFAKGSCKFGPKCAKIHVLPDGRRINYGKNGVTIGPTVISLTGTSQSGCPSTSALTSSLYHHVGGTSGYAGYSDERQHQLGHQPSLEGSLSTIDTTNYSNQYARAKPLSSSVPKGRIVDRDWDTDFGFSEEDYVPSNLQGLLTPEEKARRGSLRTSGEGSGSDSTTKYGSPVGAASPNRWGPLFQRQREENMGNNMASTAFSHVESPLQNLSLANDLDSDLEEVWLSPSPKAFEMHVWSASIGSSVLGRLTTPINEEDPTFAVSMDQDDDQRSSRPRKRGSSSLGLGGSGWRFARKAAAHVRGESHSSSLHYAQDPIYSFDMHPNFAGGPITPVPPSRDLDSGRGARSVLLEEFRANSKSTKRYDLKDIYEHIVELSGDPYGSRFIQTKLETANSDEKGHVFSEIEPMAIQLMKDVFGNYVIQKFFKHGNRLQKKALAGQMKGKVVDLSMQMYACRVVQKALEHVLVEQQAELVRELEPDIIKVVRDQNGSHVVQKVIELVPEQYIGFIMESFRGRVSQLASHAYGRLVVLCLLEHGTEKDKEDLIAELHIAANTLITDQYGYTVMQRVIEHGKLEDRSCIIALVTSQLVMMSKHRVGSKLVEKCIEFGTTEEQRRILEQLTALGMDGNCPLSHILQDKYGNYVIQKILTKLEATERDLFLEKIRPHFISLKRGGSFRRIQSLEKLMATKPVSPAASKRGSRLSSSTLQVDIHSAASTPGLMMEPNRPNSSPNNTSPSLETAHLNFDDSLDMESGDRLAKKLKDDGYASGLLGNESVNDVLGGGLDREVGPEIPTCRLTVRGTDPRSPSILDPVSWKQQSPGSSEVSFSSRSESTTSPCPDGVVQRTKEAVLRHIVNWFQTWLETRLAILEHQVRTCNPGSRSRSQQESSAGLGQTRSTRERNDSKRSRQPDDSDEPDGREEEEDDGGSDEDEGRDGSQNKGKGKAHKIKFACPFLKNNPTKYQAWRCCAWDGWPTTHRVKEHVYRKHMLPKHKCPRCCTIFPSGTHLVDHLRANERCEARVEGPQDGVTDSQAQQLRSRKRTKGQPDLLEEERWARMYGIIFPYDVAIPSPYFERCFQAIPEQSSQPRTESEILLAISDHARREFPRQLRSVLSEEFDRVLYDNLKTDRLVDVAQTVLNQILTSFPSASPDGGAVQAALAGHGGSNSRDGCNIGASASTSSGSIPGAATNPLPSPSLGDTYAAALTRVVYSPAPAQTTVPVPQTPLHFLDIFQENVLDPLRCLNPAVGDLLPYLSLASDPADSGYWSLGLSTAGECLLPQGQQDDACGFPALSNAVEEERDFDP